MNANTRLTVRTLRWVARLWSIMLFTFVIARILMPDPSITESVPFEDWFLLSLWGLAVLGLLLAWKWEFHGAVFTIAIMFIRELAWVIIKGGWIIAFLLFWLFIIPPAVMYLMAWRMERKLEVE